MPSSTAISTPRLWPCGWFLSAAGSMFGADPSALGFSFRRIENVAAAALVISLVSGAQAARPAQASEMSTVVFAPWVDGADAFAATLERSEALVWFDQTHDIYVVTGLSSGDARELYAKGALLISNRGFPPGCFGAKNESGATAVNGSAQLPRRADASSF